MEAIITRLTNYALGALGLFMCGLIISMLSFGAYSMADLTKDVIAIMIAIGMTDCVYALITSVQEIFEEK